MTELNIVDLIEKNPITKLSNEYTGQMITKIKSHFKENNQQLFVASFYCYLNYDSINDFVIDLDNVWKWIGFSSKHKASELLYKHFVINKDYKCLVTQPGEQNFALEATGEKKDSRGGHNKKIVMLTISTFKKVCLKACTKKADEIHDYFIKLEEILHETVKEESDELKLQLEQKTIQLEEEKDKSQNEKEIIREKTLLEQFSKNMQCIYYGRIDNKSTKGESLIKFGYSNELQRRVNEHKKNYTNFRLVNVFKVSNQILIENSIKQHIIFKKKIRSIIIENKNYTELLSIDDFTYEDIDKMIITIIEENEYNLENYTKLIEKNKEQEKTINELRNENIKLITDNKKLSKSALPNFESVHKSAALGLQNTSGNAFLLYAFEIKKNRYTCGLCRFDNLDSRTTMLKGLESKGEIKYTMKVVYPFTEKISSFLLKERLTKLGNDTFDGQLEDIIHIFDIVSKIEENIIDSKISLQDILQKMNGTYTEVVCNNCINPEVPCVRKSKRAIDQINKETGQIIANYPSIESAGKALGLTTGTAIGIALRNKTMCKGFLWRYSGISQEDQMTDQPVIKVSCNTGEKIFFKNIADAAKDSNVSPPGLRNRILTDVHVNNFHWIFDKSSTHYA